MQQENVACGSQLYLVSYIFEVPQSFISNIALTQHYLYLPSPAKKLQLRKKECFRTAMDMDFIAEDLDNDMEEEEDDDDGEEEGVGDHGFPDDEKKRKAYGRKVPLVAGRHRLLVISKNAGSIYRMPNHKVCDVHCKAAVVVVADLMQCFCQQRGRFHELLFDEAKRSSQRRLAGDNKRQRKSSAESSIEGSSRKGTSHASKGSHCRQVDDQRGRVPTIAIPENSSFKQSQIRLEAKRTKKTSSANAPSLLSIQWFMSCTM